MDEELLDKLKIYDPAPLECDGLVRVLHTVLNRNGVPHITKVGKVNHISDPRRKISYHYWIELEDGRFIDFRARMWLGEDSSVPHGVFNPKDYPDYVYEGQVTYIGSLPDWLFAPLIGTGFPIL
jgi:hypothetical protein